MHIQLAVCKLSTKQQSEDIKSHEHQKTVTFLNVVSFSLLHRLHASLGELQYDTTGAKFPTTYPNKQGEHRNRVKTNCCMFLTMVIVDSARL